MADDTTGREQGTSGRDYVARHAELMAGLRRIYRTVPGPMRGFNTLHTSSVADGALPREVKELMALAIGITSHCEGCIAFHVHDALAAGATRAQIEETLGVAIMMGGGPALVYAADALTALDQFEAATKEPDGSDSF
ncbi:MAG: carboxymuconolactone decarboxylase family protein [Acidimicrobiia bacterium]|nr:carboxymuconolactone decarboxylase family protein [Acidimicrobiia bacterium]MDH5291595.1 carboxymuconolactone decarboxylase family protein [Acidimicrobiia bacterium]